MNVSTLARRPFPLPSDMPGPRAATALSRAIHVLVQRALDMNKPDFAKLAERLYPGDQAVLAVLNRAAVLPASTTVPAWAAGALAGTAVADFIASLAPFSAAARLINAGVASLAGVNQLGIPDRAGLPAANLPWTVEGEPIPAKSYVLSNLTLRGNPSDWIASWRSGQTGDDSNGPIMDTSALNA